MASQYRKIYTFLHSKWAKKCYQDIFISTHEACAEKNRDISLKLITEWFTRFMCTFTIQIRICIISAIFCNLFALVYISLHSDSILKLRLTFPFIFKLYSLAFYCDSYNINLLEYTLLAHNTYEIFSVFYSL